MEALEGVPLIHFEERLGRLQRENHAPHPVTLSNALQEFRQEIERRTLCGSASEFPLANDGTLAMSSAHDFVRNDASFRAADVMRTWPKWPPALAWNAAKAPPWQPRSGIPKGWIRKLSAADYLPFAEVVKLLVFGPAMMAIGLPRVEEEAERLRAGIAIVDAAGNSEIKLVGTPCERWETQPHLLRQLGPRMRIEPNTLRELASVPFGDHNWLGPRRYAEKYAEMGHAPQSVSFYEVMAERSSLLKWLGSRATQAPRLSETAVRDLILSEKTKDSSLTICASEQLVKTKDPLFPRDTIREIARTVAVMGRRGRRRKSAN
jgi:hypothetical protein